MTPSLRSLCVTVVVAALAGGIAAWASATWVMRENTPPGLHEVIHDQIALSSDQEARIAVLEAEFSHERTRLEAELRAANRELVVAIAANRGDTPEVQAAVDHFHTAMGDLQKATLSHVFEMRAELTPEQAETFDASLVETLRAPGD